MMMNIDQNKLSELAARPRQSAAAHELRRDGSIFFVGGELPVNETLETMFESYCTESTELFYLFFGELGTFHHGEELARQIKKNFNVRLMGRLGYPAPVSVLERAYAAGVDILDIPLDFSELPSHKAEMLEKTAIYQALLAARSVFPSWSVASTLPAGEGMPEAVINGIDLLLKDGIMPLVAVSGAGAAEHADGIAAIFNHLASGWKRYEVPVKPFLPLISYMTPLIPKKQAGIFRGLIDKFQDRRQLAASDLRRHLRVRHYEDSLDSAGL
jgi:hypothetical protein